MSPQVYRYRLSADKGSTEAALVLALFAVEALHGEAGARLDASHFLDEAGGGLVIDACTRVGRDLNRLFVGFLSRELGPDSFRVERIAQRPAPPAPREPHNPNA